MGKSTLVARLRDEVPFHFSVSATTRARRPGETDGADYHFVDEPAFRRMIAGGDLLEWAEYNGNLYGTPRGPLEAALAAGHDVLLDIEVQGAAQVRAARPDALFVFVAPPSVDALEVRLRHRGDTSPAEVARRLDIARRELAVAAEMFDHVVVNDDLDTAVAEVAGILAASEETDSP